MPVVKSAQIITLVERRCAERGLRLTPLRREVLQLVAAAGGPVKAYDLLERLGRRRTSSSAPPTVYRALDFLLAHHFIHRLESLNAYICCVQPDDRHAIGHSGQFLICERCAQVTEVPAGNIAGSVRDAAKREDFAPRKQVIEVYGECRKCRSPKTRRPMRRAAARA